MRTLIIGDVHGCIRELNLLLEKIAFRAGEDRLIFVGDLINKGPNSLDVLERVRGLKAEVILGNHELGLLMEIEKPRFPREYIDWIRTWPLYIEEEDFLLIHGGLVPGEHHSKTDPKTLVRLRRVDGKPWFDFYHEKKLVIFGHWAAHGLVWKDNVIGLDTGCVYGGKLSCLVMPSRQLIQVDALKQYAPIIDKPE